MVTQCARRRGSPPALIAGALRDIYATLWHPHGLGTLSRWVCRIIWSIAGRICRHGLHHQTPRLRSVRRRDPQDRQLFLACGAATRPPSHTQHALSPSGRRRVEITATLAFRLVERGGGRDEANQAAAWAEVTAIAATRTPFLPAASRSVTGSPVVRGTDHSGHELTRTAPSDCNRITINPRPLSCLGTPPPRY